MEVILAYTEAGWTVEELTFSEHLLFVSLQRMTSLSSLTSVHTAAL